MLLLTKEESKLQWDAINCYICGKRILQKFTKSNTYWKVRDHCLYADKYRGATRSISNLKFILPDEILVDFHNGSNYDFHFI